MSGGLEIRPPVLPRRKQRSVPLQHNSVIDQPKPQEQVRQSSRLFPHLSKHSLPPSPLRRLAKAGDPALGGVEILVLQVTAVDLPHHRIGFADPRKDNDNRPEANNRQDKRDEGHEERKNVT